MPAITTFQNILSTDKLQSGFRAKFNQNVALLITDIVDNGDGTATVKLQGGTNFQINLGTSFYTKTQVQALVAGVTPAVWGAITGNVEDQTDVVGNFGVLTGIDSVLLSCNFAVASGDAGNPFGAFPASGYASFSIPGIGGTGWQLLIKEGVSSEIKFRTYYSGMWHAWESVQGDSGYKPIVVGIELGTSVSSLYTLTPSELASVNLIGQIPSFEAVTESGQGNWSDIYPIYTPYNTPGLYTEIKIVLHDGGGTNAENTVIQFSGRPITPGAFPLTFPFILT